MKLWMKVTKDKLQLPIAVADSAEELARMLGTTKTAVYSAWSHHRGTVYKLIIPDDEE